MKKLWPIGLILVYFVVLYKDFFFKGLIPVPADTLVGAYYPWLDYKWGFSVGVPVKNALISDVFSYFFIIKHLSVDILKQGIIPYWNNYSFAGTPLLATFHSSVLSPWNLFFLLPKYTGWGMYIFSSSLFSALAMYFYLTVLIKNRPARIIGALVFALSGPMTTWAEFGTAVWAAGAVPLTLLGVEMVLTHNRNKYYLLIISSLVLLIFSGHVQLLTYTLFLVPIYVLCRSRNIKKIFYIALSITAGLLLTAIQLIPTADFYTRSIRADDKYAQTFNYGLMPFTQLIRLWAPDFFGHPVTGNSWGDYIYHEYASFLGTLVLPLVIAALFYRRSFFILFFSGLFIFSLFMIIDQPLSRAFFSLPLPLITYSSASRLLFITGLSASVLTALFLDNPRWKRIIVPVILLITFTIFSNLVTPEIFRKISLRNSLLPLVQLIIILGIVLFKKFHRLLPLLLLIFISMDLSRYFIKYNPFVSESLIFPTTPVIDFLKQNSPDYRLVRQPGALMPPNTWAMYGLENIEGYDPLYLTSYNRLFHVINNQPYFNSAGRYSELSDFNPLFLDATNVKYLVAKTDTESKTNNPFKSRVKQLNYPLVFEDGHTQVFQNPGVLPRAYFVSKIETVSSEQKLAELLNRSDFDPRNTVVLLNSASMSVSTGSITDFKALPNSFSFTTMAKTGGFLVIANAYDPGWKATIDGLQGFVYRANGGLIGLAVPPGLHRVYFRYSPPYMDIALLLSSISWLGVVGSCIVLSRKIV